MNAFPLAPFLASLESDDIRPTLHDYERISLALRAGGPWTVTQLRSVLSALLAKDEDGEAIFLRRFDQFFDLALQAQADLSKLNVDRALAELQALAHGRTRAKSTESSPMSLRQPTLKPHSIATESALRRRPQESTPQTSSRTAEPPRPPEDTENALTPIETDAGEAFSPELNTPQASSEKPQSPHANQAQQDRPLFWNPNAPRHFRPGIIGGKPEPRLDAGTLDQLADLVGYFQSEQIGDALDVPASVEATGNNGGIPIMVHHKRKQIRAVLILVDVRAEALTWNPISQELAAGLAQRGIPVLYGEFHDSPAQFQTKDGALCWLEDFEDARRGYLLMIFSDGKSFHQRRDTFILESLTRWPMVVWMELRERHLWDESAVLPTRYGIPLYPATRDGLLDAMARFLTEEGSQADFSEDGIPRDWLPAHVGTNLAAYLESVLGDTLTWAQACAMIQPVSLGLADGLRIRFCTNLPPERIERLFVLPSTSYDASGLRFSNPVLAILRSGFAFYWDERRQDDVLQFILKKIGEVEPEAGSPAHLAWDWTQERVRLELRPDEALKRLSQLDQTPLHDFIRTEMENCVLPDQLDEETIQRGSMQIPLRREPTDAISLRLLVDIAEAAEIEAVDELPDGFIDEDGKIICKKDGMEMIRIPAGEFQMGSDDGFDGEKPVHTVDLDAFYIDKYEVTNQQFKVFVDANPQWRKNGISPQHHSGSYLGDWNGDDYPKGKADHPVVYVSWYAAMAYAQWVGKRLPTEAEWEKAARGGLEGKRFPWGDEDADETRANFDSNVGSTTPMDQYPPNDYGLYDMAGNVWEWCLDEWDSDFYQKAESQKRNPFSEGDINSVLNDFTILTVNVRVLRGGSWNYNVYSLRVGTRYRFLPTYTLGLVGFRCARALTP